MRTSARARFIVRHGVLRCGLPLGLAVAAWSVATDFSRELGHLQTSAGWLRLAVLLALAFAEWTLGAGWLIGAVLWALRSLPPEHDVIAPRVRRLRRHRARGQRR